MKILLVEDADYKRDMVYSFINRQFEKSSVTFSKSYSSAVKLLIEENFDLAIIDMSLPTFDKTNGDEGGEFRTYGGLDIARQIKRRKISTKFLFLTQYKSFTGDPKLQQLSDIDALAKDNYHNLYLGLVSYEHNENIWKSNLLEIISGINHV